MDKSGETPATRARKSGYTALAEMLLSQEREEEAKHADTRHPASDQDAYWGMSHSLHKLMDSEQNPPPVKPPSAKDTLLHRATCEGCKEKAQSLIEDGADVDEENDQGLTPLHLIALNGRCDLAELLLDHGANINQRENYTGKLTPMAVALLMGYDDLVEVMAARGGVC
ncbi:MAG: ankyrin repeat domain-containing protein [Candidatus Hydrogenedentes bacterium]|nr:ankyrin repeat domain-containing protein [Candidatus Hydrogenedentota bacterium]